MKSSAAVLVVLLATVGLGQTSPLDFENFETFDTEIQPSQVADPTRFRLSDDVIPVRYDLEFTPYFVNETLKTEFTFDGVAKITMRPTKTGVTSVTLHANDLEISTYTIFTTAGVSISTGSFASTQYDNETDKWTIPVGRELTVATDIVLTVNYKGFMRDDMAGFYRSYYMKNGAKVWMASTQFQSSDARRAFPCFDEPGFKAVFQVTMKRPSAMNVVSNTNLSPTTNQSVVIINGTPRVVDVFAETPSMSTYLLAFIVSNYEGNLNTTEKFGVYARPDAKAATALALDFGIKMLREFSTLFALDYFSVAGVEKMDMAAIPDFSAGAMENWGLLTYRETNILYYPEDTPAINEQRIVAVIAHEQLHMWFGDLVTCKWWSETWLNEGFARYFQYFGTKRLETTWDLEEQFVVENLQQSMQLDATASTHAMTVTSVNTKAEASAMFDNISYNKASSIIRMLSHYITLPKFEETLKAYLAINQGRAVVPDDLFSVIDSVNSGTENVTEWFAPWTVTPGFPLVTAKLENQTLKLTQKRFMRTEAGNTQTERYNIPITFAIDSESYDDLTPNRTLTFKITDPTEKTIELPKAPTKYIILNPQQTNYYRVNYDEENWKNIKLALEKDNFDGIHVLNRAQIVDDLFNLARAGIVKYNFTIDIIRYLKNEKHYIPMLSAINQGFTFLSQRVKIDDREQKLFNWLITDTMSTAYEYLSFDEKTTDTRTEKYNRVNILSWICKYGHSECIAKSKELFSTFKANTTAKIPKNLRSLVYCNAIRHGNSSDFDFLYDRFLAEDVAAEQLNLLAGMACTKVEASITKYLELLITSGDVRRQDYSTVINNLLNANPEGPDYLYNYITANHAKWSATIGSLSTLTTVAGRFTTSAQFDTYSAWLKSVQTALGASYTTLNADLETARKNLDWDAVYMKEIMDHLEVINSATAKAMSLIITVISFTVLYFFQ